MELIACRACLAMDCKLYNLNKYGLAQIYTESTSLLISSCDGLPQHICYICCALLLKHAAFRTRCHSAYAILNNVRNTGQVLKQILNTNRNPLSLPLTIENVNKLDVADSKIDVDEVTHSNTQSIYEDIVELKQEINTMNNSEENFDLNGNDAYNISFKRSQEEMLLSKEWLDLDKRDINCMEIQPIFVPLDDKDCSQDSQKSAENDLKNTAKSTLDNNKNCVVDSISNIHSTNKKEKVLKKQIDKKPRVLKTVVKKHKIELTFSDSDDEVLANKTLKCTKETKIINRNKKTEDFAKKHNMKVAFYTKEEQIKEVALRKESQNYKKARLKCEICFKGFATDTAFNNHKIVHDPLLYESLEELKSVSDSNRKRVKYLSIATHGNATGQKRGRHFCEMCQMYFPKKGALDRHLEEHRVKYTCEQCGDIFTNPHLARTHFKFHSGVQYECETCKKVFRKLTTYYNHIRNSHATSSCCLCGESFVGEQGLKNHMQKTHREALNARCTSCGVQFQSDAILKLHADSGCTPDICACSRCGAGLPSSEQRAEHMQLVHKARTYTCDECHKTFSAEHHLGVHWNNMHGGRTVAPRTDRKDRQTKYMCDQCGKSFKGRTAFTFHMRVHTGERPHQCPVCVKTFRLPMSLKLHLSTHTDERPYRCPLCPRAFRQPTHRQTHMRTHTQEKPHSCSICAKRFSLPANLREHSRAVHAGLPPRRRKRQ